MHDVVNAFTTFFDHIRAIAWTPVLYALLCQLAKIAARTRAWRNILAAAFPGTRVRWRSVAGAYLAGVGVNSIVPVRGGDLLKLYLVKQRIEGATYATLGATLFVETITDVAISGALLIWALQANVLPGVNVLNRLPSVDWFWLFRHPRTAVIVIVVVVALGVLASFWAAARIAAFRARVRRGASILRTPGRYLRTVVLWQVVDWMLRIAVIFFFLRAFHVTANLHNALRVQVTASLSTIVPLTPAGIGTDQALIVYVLAGQASRSALLSLSVGMKAIVSALSITLGLISTAAMLRTLRWRHAVESDRAESEPAQ